MLYRPSSTLSPEWQGPTAPKGWALGTSDDRGPIPVRAFARLRLRLRDLAGAVAGRVAGGDVGSP